MDKLMFIVLAIALVSPQVASGIEEAQLIKAELVLEMLKEGVGVWVIDVRNEASYQSEHIEGSINIPAALLPHRKLPEGKPVVLVDDSLGLRTAREAAVALTGKGYERVYVLDGGLAAWKAGGLNVSGNKPFVVLAVTASELQWALSNNVQLRMFDMRDPGEREKGKIAGSALVEGKDATERAENLGKFLNSEYGDKGLAGRLKKTEPLVLVFSSSDDAEKIIERNFSSGRMDVRYLLGGYYALTAKKDQKVSGSCKTCAGK